MPYAALDQGFDVRMKGLEPPSLAALDPKSSASTNFATSALFIIVCNFISLEKKRLSNLLVSGLFQNLNQTLKTERKDRYSLYFYKSTKEYFR